MYIPPDYKEDDEQKLMTFMKAHSFAIIVSAHNSNIRATHLPFIVEMRNDKIYLVTHMARSNPQWQEFLQNELLIVFQGPHAYISPTHYEKKQNVPTWNYLAVHAYGKARLIEEPSKAIEVLETMILTYEGGYYEQWKTLSPDYINAMIKGIMAFEIEVTRLEGKFKLSQDKTKTEQKNIIHTFEKSNDSSENALSEEMKKNL